ncbi:MAG: M15 family metallopeptidase [Candidatus Paceibacterota bacterium]|jgi:D-alanyl-D-alanine carboxypeptidase
MRFLKRSDKLKFVFMGIILLAFVCSFGINVWLRSEIVHSPSPADKHVSTVVLAQTPQNAKITAKPSGYSTTDSTSMWVVVNKQHPLSPLNYIPNDLVTTNGATVRSFAKSDFVALVTDSKRQGINLMTRSSYRSYSYQNNLYNNYVATFGRTNADTFSARPGYSEHQTGLAIDFGSNTIVSCNLIPCFCQTKEGQWLAAHAYEYGYILRYPADKQSITGYESEPWHYRYVGHELANAMKNKSILTLEEYFNIAGGTIYK